LASSAIGPKFWKPSPTLAVGAMKVFFSTAMAVGCDRSSPKRLGGSKPGPKLESDGCCTQLHD